MKVKMQQKAIVPTEFEEQSAIFEWAKAMSKRYPCLNYMSGSLNGIRLPLGLAVKAKKNGLLKGFPDIFLPYNNGTYTGLFIELKRLKGGVVSPEQTDFIEYLNSQGYKAVVCKGHSEAISTIFNFIKEVSNG